MNKMQRIVALGRGNLDLKKAAKYTVGFSLALCSFAEMGLACEGRTLSVGWEEWAPFIFPENGVIKGTDAEMVQAILERAGCKVVMLNMPWARQLRDLEAGKIDLVFTASKTEEREKFAYFTEPYMLARNVLFMKADAAEFLKLKTLDEIKASKGFTLAVGREASVGTQYNEAKKDPAFKSKLVETEDDEQTIKMLNGGRVSAIIGDPISITALVKEKFPDLKLSISPIVVDDEESAGVFMALSKKSTSEKLVTAINSAIVSLYSENKARPILEKYLASEDVEVVMLKAHH